MIECREEKKLVDFYLVNGFEEIQRSSDGNHIMVLHTATFRGHQGRVLRPDRAILSGQS